MPHDRFFIDAPLNAGETITLGAEEARHLIVMRCHPADTLEIVNGRHALAQARLTHLDKKQATLQITSCTRTPPPPPLILAQALPRAPRLDNIIEKGTELGATEFWLFPGEYSEKISFNLPRLQKIAIAALKQCGRLDLPQILLKPPLSEWQPLPFPAFFGDTNPSAPPFQPPSPPLIFFTGPERGFSPHEITLFHRLSALGVKLHRHTLRTDTASLTALALIK